MKEVRASAPVNEADIDAELAAGTEEPDLEEEDAASDMGGDAPELPEPYAEYEAQHSLASMQHSRGQATSGVITIIGVHCLTDTIYVRLLKRCACGGALRTDNLTKEDHLLWTLP